MSMFALRILLAGRLLTTLSLIAIVTTAPFRGFTQSGATPNPGDLTKLNDVLLPAPNAASLSKFGGVEFDLSSGRMSKSIPLYTYKYRGMQIPLSLSYSSNGFRLDETASRIGFGWALNAGGVINRVMYGRVDEMIDGRLTTPTSFGDNQATWDFVEQASNPGNRDAQPDIYSFNFCGYSGKFLFDENMNIQLMPVANFKVEYDFSQTRTWDFRITIPDGIKYYFGGSAIEKTRSEGCSKPTTDYVTSSYYLFKIEDMTGDVITFSYQTIAPFIFYRGASQVLYYNNPSNDQLNRSTCAYVYPSAACTIFNHSLCSNILRSQGIYLTQISSNNGENISFTYTNRYDCGDVLLQNIKIKDRAGNAIRNFDCAYTHDNGTVLPSFISFAMQRPFLTSVTESSGDGIITKPYNFYYNGLGSLPAQNSFAMDHWGFYNGKSNSVLTAQPPDNENQIYFPQANANRDADPLYTRKGMLSKIEYPTKGWDTIYYEGNTYYGSRSVYPNPSTVSKNVTGTGLYNSVSAQTSLYTISFEQVVQLNYTVAYQSGSTVDPLHNKGTVSIIDQTGTIIFSDVYTADNIQKSRSLILAAGKFYRLQVQANGATITTTASITWRIGSITTVSSNYYCGGVRVAKVASYAFYNAPPVIKRYYYYKLNAPTQSSGVIPNSLKYAKPFYTRKGYVCNSNGGAWGYDYCEHSSVYSSSLISQNKYSGGMAYQNVTEGFGNNFEGGAIEHTFQLYENLPSSGLSSMDFLDNAPYGNHSDYSGKELVQTIYKAGIVPIKKVVNTYKTDLRKNKLIASYTINKRYENLNGTQETEPLLAYEGAVSFYYSKWEYLDSKQEIAYSDNGTETMTSTTQYFYDNATHLQLTRIKTLNSDKEALTTVVKYPDDFADLSGTSDRTKGVKALQTNYIIKPVEVSQYKKVAGSDSLLTSSVFLDYYSANALPQAVYKVETDKPLNDFTPASSPAGNILVDSRYKPKISFDGYDAKYNLLQQSKDADLKLSYIWDYNREYPIAEVKNGVKDAIAYTSFEAENTSNNWTLASGTVSTASAVTGVKSFTLGGTNSIAKSGLPSGKYIVSYWKNGTGSVTINGASGTSVTTKNGWMLYRHVLNSVTSVNVSGTAVIDELRLYPFVAQITTSTYNPLTGATSTCDASDHIMYYEYDGLARLKLARNSDNKIVKQYDYQYQTQSLAPPPCSPSNCIGADKKCVNGSCETAIKKYTSKVKQGANYGYTWVYQWSDCSESSSATETYTTDPNYVVQTGCIQ